MANQEKKASVGLGERLRKARKDKNLTQQKLAVMAGVVQQTINKLERGIMTRPTEQLIIEIAKHLDVSPAWLMFGAGEIDRLSKEAIEFAIDFDGADEETKTIIAMLLKKGK